MKSKSGIKAKLTVGITPILAEQLNDEHLQNGFVKYINAQIAAEGDMNSYSEGFKNLLISKGMPEWAFKLRTVNPRILSNMK